MKTFDLSEVEFHSFHWDNFDRKVLSAHKRVMEHFNLNVNYTQENIPHGEWLNRVIGNAKSKVVAIIEPDLIPLNREIVEQAAHYVYENDTFLGCAQASNHIHPACHIFASPAFFFITPSCYERLGRSSFMPIKYRSDVAEEISFRAEKLGIRYRTLYPTCFEVDPVEGVWALGSYGFYGIGTVFDDSVYHLFQSRFAQNVELFVRRCDEVIQGAFDSSEFIPSITFNDSSRMVQPAKPAKWHKRLRAYSKALLRNL